MERRRYFATTSKGLEEVLAGEVAAIGGEEIAVAQGGVAFAGDFALGYRANLHLRTANRVLLHLADFPAVTPDDLYEGVKAIPWPDLFDVTKTLAVDAAVRDSGIDHSRFAALKAKDAIVDRFRDRFGRRPDVDPLHPRVRIHLRIVRDACTVSLDLSGESLNRRGYRGDATEASLRETLAAGLVLLAGWDGRVPLIDPMCGSGSIPIEAALIATETAPGLLRRQFAFRELADHDPKLWDALISEARGRAIRKMRARIEGSDIDPAVIRGAGENAKRAGVAAQVKLSVRDIRLLDPGGPPGILLFNPPYGVRMRPDAAMETLYGAIGEALKKRCAGWTAWVLSGNPDATKDLGLKAARRIPVMNGPIDCRLLKYELY